MSTDQGLMQHSPVQISGSRLDWRAITISDRQTHLVQKSVLYPLLLHPARMHNGDSSESLLKKRSNAVKSSWSADAADVFVLLCSFLLVAASIVLVALIFDVQAYQFGVPVPVTDVMIPALQRGISALSATITSALIMVAGKRYVLYKFARGGLRSQRVAVYARPSIGNLAHYLVFHGLELPLFTFLAVWILGLATGLTVNDTSGVEPLVNQAQMGVPFGPVGSPDLSFLDQAFGQMNLLMASVYFNFELEGTTTTGSVDITGDMPLTSGGQMGQLVYPPLPQYAPSSAFSLPALLNGFNISVESISSIPATAQNLTCVDGSTDSGFSTGQLWYDGSDNQTLAIVTSDPGSQSLYRFNASSIVMGGTLVSLDLGVQFVLNGTTWPNMMPSNRWADDIVTLICNASDPTGLGGRPGQSLHNFSVVLNEIYTNGIGSPVPAVLSWSSALSMAMGAYSSAAWQSMPNPSTLDASVTYNDILYFRSRYGVYVLIANALVSTIMVIVIVRLRLASRLGADFIDVTRLLLDPLKNAELFNASLDTTVKARANPYMLVREGGEFLLADELEA